MRLKIHHTTAYNFSENVFLEPHYLNFKPLQRPYYQLKEFHLNFEPNPTGYSERLDAENNPVFQVWVVELTDHFKIEAKIILDIHADVYSPLKFIIDPWQTMKQGGLNYFKTTNTFLTPYLNTAHFPELDLFTKSIFKDKNGDVVAGLFELLDQIYRNWKHEKIDEETELNPDVCFNRKSGSCRDLAWMVITMLRMQGIACRFVSGYAYSDELEEGHELHAWVEVFLPGAGWVGIDPSLGLFTNEFYVPVASSFDPANTMPVIGSYRGDAVSKMATSLSIELLEDS